MGLRRGLAALTVAGAVVAATAYAGPPDHAVTATAASAPAADGKRVEGWPVRSPASVGLRGSALREGAQVARRRDSTCFAVLRNGKLVREDNWTLRRDAPREVFSITKSVTSTLVGIAVRDGDLRLDDRVSRYVPQWRGTASATVTVRNLLANDSGRFWSLQSDYADLLAARSRTAYAIGLPQQHAPGTAWAYNNAAIQVLERVLERSTGMGVARYARTRLFEPLGMARTRFITDRADDAAVFYGLQTTCLDLARFGMLQLGRGNGYLWWLNRPGLLRGAKDAVDAQGQPLRQVTGQLAPSVGEDVYAALGFGGQVLLVDPTTRTMVVRIGLPAQAGEEAYGFVDAATVLSRAVR